MLPSGTHRRAQLSSVGSGSIAPGGDHRPGSGLQPARSGFALAVVASLIAALGALAVNANQASAASWAPTTGSLNESRSHHTETKLDNGKVLVVGGRNGSSSIGPPAPTFTYRASAELYDPATQTWSSCTAATATASCPGPLAQARSHHTATKLANGRVLVVGGRNSSGFLATAQVYNPADGTWSTTASMGATGAGPAIGRADHTATLLHSPPCEADPSPPYCGKVLVAGGRNNTGALTTAELYDPTAGSWTPTGPLAGGRANHTATLLSAPVPEAVKENDAVRGMVLVAGGRTGASVGSSGGVVLASAELYNPTLGVWVPAGPMTDLRSDHTATLLTGGRVLMAGGNIGEAGVNDPFTQGAAIITDTSDLYNPDTNTHTPSQLLDHPRADHTATRLNGTSCVGTGRTIPCDNVLAAGRIDGNGVDEDGNPRGRTSEIYNYDLDPIPDIDDNWLRDARLVAERANHTATLLNDGKVLVAGGVDGAGIPGSTAALASSELYTPTP